MNVTATDALIVVGMIAGIGVGIDAAMGSDRRDLGQGYRWALLVAIALVAWAWSDSWRGFAYTLLMPIGAYKVGDIVASSIALALPRRTRQETK